HSVNPFELYGLLNKRKQAGEVNVASSSLSHPPGFTPVGSVDLKANEHVNDKGDSRQEDVVSPVVNAKRFSREFKRNSMYLGNVGVQERSCRWNGDAILMGDFNEVRSREERRGSCFNPYSARVFDNFISSSGLVDIKIEGYAFTWSHPSVSKMSKLDRFLVTDGLLVLFSSITVVCLDRHLSDHRLILLHEVHVDFGLTPFRDQMDGSKWDLIKELRDVDKDLDQGVVSDYLISKRHEVTHQLQDFKSREAVDFVQKSKLDGLLRGTRIRNIFMGLLIRSDL
nr:RNA-directed DNA polymerase, eukaryota [Tanacetum cinerariifolium]